MNQQLPTVVLKIIDEFADDRVWSRKAIMLKEIQFKSDVLRAMCWRKADVPGVYSANFAMVRLIWEGGMNYLKTPFEYELTEEERLKI